ncbi:conserved hypothetical protein [Planktothrix serta PCC 8927]|uniref:Uncharacterized protein n=1 Tax=Planktothrix serta PCC 8927 TaxID=671068 RepID=A0A7Z9DWS3_9CYAN|nr:hypothetical protein [Planktothrix serta]VXD15258.1 conserved hypothetical protein [Planktothrix serta PCC 8927]
MVNILEEGDNGLVRVDYGDLLTKILQVLENQQVKNPLNLSQDGKRLLIDIDEIAAQVSELNIANPLGGSTFNAKSATVNLSPGSRNAFISQIQQIRDILTQKIESILVLDQKPISLENFINNLAIELKEFQGESQDVGFQYKFDKKYDDLHKQRLSLQKETDQSSSVLKFHKLTITVEKTNNFNQQLKNSLKSFIELRFDSEEEKEDLGYILEDLCKDLEKNKSDLYKLKCLMDTETIGKLQREAKIQYLEYLKEHLGQHRDLIYLEDLIRRLRLIEDYINDINQGDGYYQVNYAGVSVNYKEIFSRSEAFEELPIIPLIVGYLGETTDENSGKRQFIFGLKLKFAGKVQTQGGKSVINYYLNLLDSNSPEHQEGLADASKKEYFVRKVLKIAFLYYFIFASIDPSTPNYHPEDDLEYNPRTIFEEKVLPILQASDETQKQRIFRGIKTGLETYKIDHKVDKLKNMLTNFLRGKTVFPSRSYPIHISVKQGILETDYTVINRNNSFFKTVLKDNPKAALKYISVGGANVDNNALYSISANLQISEIHYFSTQDDQTFSMEYDLRNVYTIPVVLTPQHDRCREIFKNSLKGQNLLVFNYNYRRLRENILNNLQSSKAFAYQFTFALLAYILLKTLLDRSKRRLFIPILRLHLSDQQETAPEEKFMRSMFSVLSHLLNENHRSNSQGFCVKKVNPFKLKNGLSSLYSILPKIFEFSQPVTEPQLDKLAIIVVSSRECDRSRSSSSDYKIANLMGEMIGIQRQKDGKVRLYMIGTFSDNYNSQEIHSHPDVLIDQVNQLYEQGYRHFLYIAKSPYSNTLNMTKKQEDEELFFMSKSVIRALKGEREDLKIYPIFFDKYYAVKLDKIPASSLYIQDISELETLVKDPSKQAVVFFNLFNGIKVGNDKYYNGVISYATLLNIYEGILDDKDIRMALMYDNSLKNELLQFLTLFHFSRYEADSNQAKNINLKLDPYTKLIGDNSVGALSRLNHINSYTVFNSLAFLTEVRKILNVPQED